MAAAAKTSPTKFADRSHRDYAVGTMCWMAVYVVSLGLLSWLDHQYVMHPALLVCLALLPGLAVCGQLFVTLRLMARTDEFMRAMMAKRFIIAAGLTFAAATIWGFLETFADWPHLPLYVVYMAFWFFFGLVSPFVKSSR